MSKHSQYIKGTIVGEFWCRESKKGEMYLSGKLSDEHGGIKVTLIRQYSKENNGDADYLLLTFPTNPTMPAKQMQFSPAIIQHSSSIAFDEDESSNYSDDDLERWLAEKEQRKNQSK